VLCALALFGLSRKNEFLKFSSEPRLGPVGFRKNKTPKVLFENKFKFELEKQFRNVSKLKYIWISK
jgi:hypothetical protein